MNTSHSKIIIIPKKGNENALQLAGQIASWLSRQNIFAVLAQAGSDYNNLLENPDFALVLGGDGTILEVARHYVQQKTIILGINFGRIGFLTAATSNNWQTILTQALESPEKAQKCLALRWQLFGRNGSITGVAVNDLVLSHGAIARLVALEVKVNNVDNGKVRSDGLIFFSPLGSTGYNTSAGGPVLFPQMDALGMTLICPFMISVPSLIFPAATSFQVRLDQESPSCYLTVDGQENYAFEAGDQLNVGGVSQAVWIWGCQSKYITRFTHAE